MIYPVKEDNSVWVFYNRMIYPVKKDNSVWVFYNRMIYPVKKDKSFWGIITEISGHGHGWYLMKLN